MIFIFAVMVVIWCRWTV